MVDKERGKLVMSASVTWQMSMNTSAEVPKEIFGKMKKKTHHRESHTTVKDNKIIYVKEYKWPKVFQQLLKREAVLYYLRTIIHTKILKWKKTLTLVPRYVGTRRKRYQRIWETHVWKTYKLYILLPKKEVKLSTPFLGNQSGITGVCIIDMISYIYPKVIFLFELQLVNLRGTRERYKIERYRVKEC